jgi:L-erythro-3,5-diaminohexanoate dehydrogenase
MAADVTMLVGNGYTPGHAALALDLYRQDQGVRTLIDPRVAHSSPGDPRVHA